VYKVVTKIIANRLTTVISGLISNTQSAFIANRHILDGPFILNEVLAWCKRRRKQALVFKVDFAKAYDSVRWDFLSDVLIAFSFGPKSWKVKTLSIGGRLTLLKLVFGTVPIYNMSLYKAPKCMLHELERLRNNFFKGGDSQDSKITWVVWAKVLSSKKNGGLRVSSFFALNRGSSSQMGMAIPRSRWFFVLFALELDKDISVAAKWSAPSFGASFRRHVRYGVERNQWYAFLHMLGTITLSSSPDRYFCDLNDDGAYRVKDIRSELDDLFLPSSAVANRWNIQSEEVSSFVDWFTWFGSIRLPSKLKAVLEGVFYSAWWHV
nr:RNA-directed DNA polymerase, eukaryota, reverse transcriptase zinc-binding domain protein [Tanacetum cinerariifolium]